MINAQQLNCGCEGGTRIVPKENALNVSGGCAPCDCASLCDPLLYLTWRYCDEVSGIPAPLDTYGTPERPACMNFYKTDSTPVNLIPTTIEVIDSVTGDPVLEEDFDNGNDKLRFFLFETRANCNSLIVTFEGEVDEGEPSTTFPMNLDGLNNYGLPEGHTFSMIVYAKNYLPKFVTIVPGETYSIELEKMNVGEGGIALGFFQAISTQAGFPTFVKPTEPISFRIRNNTTGEIFTYTTTEMYFVVPQLFVPGHEFEIVSIQGWRKVSSVEAPGRYWLNLDGDETGIITSQEMLTTFSILLDTSLVYCSPFNFQRSSLDPGAGDGNGGGGEEEPFVILNVEQSCGLTEEECLSRIGFDITVTWGNMTDKQGESIVVHGQVEGGGSLTWNVNIPTGDGTQTTRFCVENGDVVSFYVTYDGGQTETAIYTAQCPSVELSASFLETYFYCQNDLLAFRYKYFTNDMEQGAGAVVKVRRATLNVETYYGLPMANAGDGIFDDFVFLPGSFSEGENLQVWIEVQYSNAPNTIFVSNEVHITFSNPCP